MVLFCDACQGGRVLTQRINARISAGLPRTGAGQTWPVPLGSADCIRDDVPGTEAVGAPWPGCKEHTYSI